MAIAQVRARVNGTWHTLTYDAASGAYKATITAPGATSYNQADWERLLLHQPCVGRVCGCGRIPAL